MLAADANADVTEVRGKMLANLRQQEALKANLHHTAARFLVSLADVVVLPRLRVKGLVGRGGVLSKTWRSSLLSVGHGEFRVVRSLLSSTPPRG